MIVRTSFTQAATFLNVILLSTCLFAQDTEVKVSANTNAMTVKPITVENAQLTLIDNVRIATRDAGIIEKLNAKEGDEVQSGQVLLQLDKAMHEAERSAALAEVEIAKKESENDIDLRYAEKSAEVNRKVLARSCDAVSKFSKSISKTEIERLELELERSILSGDQALHKRLVNELNLELRKEQLRVSDLRLNYRAVASPLNGVVAEVLAQNGEWVAAGQPVVRVIGLDRLRLEALFNQKDAFRIQKGQDATFELVLDGEPVSATGQVVFVSPEIDPLTEEFLVRIEVDNSERKLRPGLKGKLTIETE